jgi:hypothetical protein
MLDKSNPSGRADERFFLLGHGEMRWGGETIAIQVVNRSRSGLYVLSPGAPPVGAIAQITLTVGKSKVQARCEVTRHDDWHRGLPYLLGLRLRFSEASSRVRDRWERFNRELVGGLVYGQASVEGQGSDRTFRRVLVPMRARLESPGSASEAALLNLSEYGAGILAPHPLRKGEGCELTVSLPDHATPVRLPAEVAWCGAAPRDLPVGLGLRLVDFEGAGRQHWESNVQEDMIVLF